MNAKKMMFLLGLTTALGGSAVARDNDSWGWHYDTQDQGWEDSWEEEELVSIPSSNRHVRPQESANFIAKVVAYNRTNEWVKIVAGGQVITWLGPMERRKLRLDANVGRIQAVVGDRVLRSKRVRSGLREAQPFRIDPPRTGMIKVKNDLRYAVRVVVNGRIIGSISPRSAESFELDTGSSRLELVAVNSRGQTRRLGSKRIQVEPFATETVVTPELRRKKRRRRAHSRAYSRR